MVCVIADIKTFKQETNGLNDFLNEQNRALEDMRVEQHKKLVMGVGKRGCVGIVSTFCLIFLQT